MEITYPEHLPVSERREDIAAAIRDHQVVIVAGETGSGKTTQLPKICLELGRGAGREGGGGLIGHTQPRRIAARSVAERIADELGTELGDLVGYQVRFTDRTSASSRIKLMTDGILLAELQRDRDLKKYDTIIIDEAHERSLNIDFLLGYLKRLLPRRPDLKLIVTSATIDTARFAEHFADARTGEPAPVIEVSGRTFPVEIRYRPLMELPEDDPDAEPGEVMVRDQTEAIVDAVKELSAEGPGDILVFLPGEREIRDTADALADIGRSVRGGGGGVEIVPLYSRLSAADQHRVFQPHTGRRVVLSTNVAETSLTVPGIRYVVDSGVARISRYSARSKVQRLPIEAISQASANQRSGRCGRVEAGIAIRLYSEEDFEGRPEFTDPEILRTNLASVILQMASLGLGEIDRFPFVEAPDHRNVAAGVQLLEELGALSVGRGLDTPPRSSAATRPAESSRSSAATRPAESSRSSAATRPAESSRSSAATRPAESSRSSAATRPAESSRSSAAARPAGGPHLTQLGRKLARLPIDPRLARMILEAERLGCVREVIVIAAALSLQDPRERPGQDRPKEQAQADQLHARYKHEASDFLTWLNLWRYIKEQQKELSSSAFRRMCKREFLNYLRVREWQEFESQLRQVCKEMKIQLGAGGELAPDFGANEDGIHQALLSGLLSHIGMLEEREKESCEARSARASTTGRRRPAAREYLGARNTRFALFPGSVLHRKNPQFVMAGELIETSRLWARQNAAIKPEWAERLAGDLVKRTHSEPHWSRKRAAVMARERVTLYGVPLVADRLINYGRIDAAVARELFIRHALVYGEWQTHHRFLAENAALMEEAKELEHRARRRDIVVDEHTLFDFYDARIPENVVSGAHFDRWWKQQRDKRLLTFDLDMLTREHDIDEAEFPSQWESGPLTFEIGYHFEPGTAEDGLTIDVPVATLNRVGDEDFSWNVPGLREELVTALIRSLPKSLRTSFVPAPDQARRFLAEVPAGEEPLLDALERWGRATAGVHIPREAWDRTKVPEHLRPTYRVVDESGEERARGKDLAALKAPLAGEFRKAIAEVATDAGLARTGLTAWTIGDLPATVTEKRAGHEVTVYPALDDEGATAGVVVCGGVEEAEARHRLGVARLLLLATASPVKQVIDGLSMQDKLALASTPYANTAALVEDCRAAVVQQVVDARPRAMTQAAFAELRAALGSADDHRAAVAAVLADVLRALASWREVDKVLSGRADMYQLPALTDMLDQVARLMHVEKSGSGFIREAGATQLRRYPTYLAAIIERRRKLDQNVNVDRQTQDRIADLQEHYLHQVAALPPGRPPGERLRQARWMLEEYRIQLWAQQLGTAQTVSDQRIRKVLG